jgi:hypothetical protein
MALSQFKGADVEMGMILASRILCNDQDFWKTRLKDGSTAEETKFEADNGHPEDVLRRKEMAAHLRQSLIETWNLLRSAQFGLIDTPVRTRPK